MDYTDEMKLPLPEDGSYNWGAVINGILELLDAGHEITLTFGEAVAAGSCVAIKTTDGKVYKAKATDSTLTPAIGLAPDAVTSGNEGKVRDFGWLDVDTSYSFGADLSWAAGEPAYVGSVAGRLAKTAQSWSNVVGWCKATTNSSYLTRFRIGPTLRVSDLVYDLRVQRQAVFTSEIANGNSGASKTFDWRAGNKQTVTMTDDCEFTFTAPAGPCNLVLRIVQDGTGSRTVTWPGTCKWAGGTAPTLTTTAWAIDVVCFYFDGMNYYGSAVLDML